MYYAIKQQQDEYGHLFGISARRGGYKSLQSAISALIKAGTGYVVDDTRTTVAVVKDGVDLMSRESQSFPHPRVQNGAPPV